jgi:hypothetical protein
LLILWLHNDSQSTVSLVIVCSWNFLFKKIFILFANLSVVFHENLFKTWHFLDCFQMSKVICSYFVTFGALKMFSW